MNRLIFALIGLSMSGIAIAKLPQLSEEAKAQAAEAKNKSAWSDKIAAYKLCLAQDKVAAHYRKTKAADPAKPAAASPPEASAASAVPPAVAAPVAPPVTPATPQATAAAPPSTSATPPVAATVAPVPIVIPPCQDPGPYVSAQAAEKVGVADSLPVPAAGKTPTPAEVKK